MAHLSWHIEALRIPDIWQRTRGQGIHVAVLDSGLAGEVAGLPEPRVRLFDKRGTPIPRSDREGHGTMVASALGSETQGRQGVAPQAQLSCFNIYDASSPVAEDAASAIEVALGMGVDLICAAFTMPAIPQVLDNALRHAKQRNVPVVASAGNGHGVFSPFPEMFSSSNTRPVEEYSVISVAASDENDEIFRGRIGAWTTIAAPGLDIRVQGRNGPTTFTGTSAAAPVAAGIVALALARARARGNEIDLRQNLVDRLFRSGQPNQTPRIINPFALLNQIG